MINAATGLPFTVAEACARLNECCLLSERESLNLLGIITCASTVAAAQTSDPEILCAPSDGRPVIAFISTIGGATTFFEVNGTTPYVGATPIRCAGAITDIEQVTSCRQITIAGIYGAIGDTVTEIRWFDTSTITPTQIAQVFINQNSQTVVAGITSANSQPCVEENKTIEIVCLCDDTLGDGSVIVQFKRIKSISSTGVVTTLADYDEDLVTPYTPLGTVVCCSELGTLAQVTQEREVLNGAGFWAVPGNAVSYSIKVLLDAGNPTFTSSSGSVTRLFAGETSVFNDNHDSAEFFQPGANVNTLAGDRVVIEFQRLV